MHTCMHEYHVCSILHTCVTYMKYLQHFCLSASDTGVDVVTKRHTCVRRLHPSSAGLILGIAESDARPEIGIAFSRVAQNDVETFLPRQHDTKLGACATSLSVHRACELLPRQGGWEGGALQPSRGKGLAAIPPRL